MSNIRLKVTKIKKKSRGLIKRVVALGLIMLGIALLFLTPAYRFGAQVLQKQVEPSAEPIKAAQEQFKEEVTEDELPVRIIIPSIGADLPVTPSKIVKGYWEISETTASFGLGSAPPGKVGNTVIFAHAREGLFGDLPKIKNEDIIYVLTKNEWFAYRVSEIKVVWPRQVEVIAPTEDETLTLYTCSGFVDTKRLIVIGKRFSI